MHVQHVHHLLRKRKKTRVVRRAILYKARRQKTGKWKEGSRHKNLGITTKGSKQYACNNEKRHENKSKRGRVQGLGMIQKKKDKKKMWKTDSPTSRYENSYSLPFNHNNIQEYRSEREQQLKCKKRVKDLGSCPRRTRGSRSLHTNRAYKKRQRKKEWLVKQEQKRESIGGKQAYECKRGQAGRRTRAGEAMYGKAPNKDGSTNMMKAMAVEVENEAEQCCSYAADSSSARTRDFLEAGFVTQHWRNEEKHQEIKKVEKWRNEGAERQTRTFIPALSICFSSSTVQLAVNPMMGPWKPSARSCRVAYMGEERHEQMRNKEAMKQRRKQKQRTRAQQPKTRS